MRAKRYTPPRDAERTLRRQRRRCAARRRHRLDESRRAAAWSGPRGGGGRRRRTAARGGGGGGGREGAALADAERSVVVVALTLAALDELGAVLATHQPVRCADIFAKDGLRLNLSRKGSVAIALSGALPLDL